MAEHDRRTAMESKEKELTGMSKNNTKEHTKRTVKNRFVADVAEVGTCRVYTMRVRRDNVMAAFWARQVMLTQSTVGTDAFDVNGNWITVLAYAQLNALEQKLGHEQMASIRRNVRSTLTKAQAEPARCRTRHPNGRST